MSYSFKTSVAGQVERGKEKKGKERLGEEKRSRRRLSLGGGHSLNKFTQTFPFSSLTSPFAHLPEEKGKRKKKERGKNIWKGGGKGMTNPSPQSFFYFPTRKRKKKKGGGISKKEEKRMKERFPILLMLKGEEGEERGNAERGKEGLLIFFFFIAKGEKKKRSGEGKGARGRWEEGKEE